MMHPTIGCLTLCLTLWACASGLAEDIKVTESKDEVSLETSVLKAKLRRKGYVTGVAARSLVDKQTGFTDEGFGLDIVDWIMEPGSDVGTDRSVRELPLDETSPLAAIFVAP